MNAKKITPQCLRTRKLLIFSCAPFTKCGRTRTFTVSINKVVKTDVQQTQTRARLLSSYLTVIYARVRFTLTILRRFVTSHPPPPFSVKWRNRFPAYFQHYGNALKSFLAHVHLSMAHKVNVILYVCHLIAHFIST